MKYVLDVHTHTIASGHAYNTIKEMAQSASEKRAGVVGNHRTCNENAGNLSFVLFCKFKNAGTKDVWGRNAVWCGT